MRQPRFLVKFTELNLGRALTGDIISKSTVSDFICDPDACFIRGFQVNNIGTLNAIKIHLNWHMLKSPDAIYLLTLSTNVEANNDDPDQQQSILYLHCLTKRLLKNFSRR